MHALYGKTGGQRSLVYYILQNNFFCKSHAYFYDVLIREKDKIPFSVRLFSCQIYVINKFAVMDDVLFTHI